MSKPRRNRIMPTLLLALAGLAAPAVAQEAPGTVRVDPMPSDEAVAAMQFARGLSSAFKHAAAIIEPSVVHITSVEIQRQVVRDRFGRPVGLGDEMARPAGLGSGVIVDALGHIVTNNHVIEKADKLVVRLDDGREYDARVVGADPSTDVAVLKIEAERLTPAIWGDSEGAEVGQWVIAVGSPFGFDQTVTAGIVSAKGRPSLSALDAGIDTERWQEFLQTDAAINPGNSGGPLVDLDGHILGINTAIASRSGGNNGLGFAIPADLARAVATGIIDTGRVQRGYLGVGWGEQPAIPADEARALGIAGGVRLTVVDPDGPAGRAGLVAGDIVTSFNGRTTENANRLRNAIAITPPGTAAVCEYVREGSRRVATVTVTDRNDAIAAQIPGTRLPDVGIIVEPTTLDVSRRGRVIGREPGLLVRAVEPGSPADRSGVNAGDVILGADGREVESVDALRDRVDGSGLREGVMLRVFRPAPNGQGGMTGELELRR
jgi:serine protease Do